MKSLNLKLYFKRIGLEETYKDTSSTYKSLSKIVYAHITTIPFENLDINLGREIKVDILSIFNKVVYKKRGGYCFEVNGLMHAVLKQLGFKVRPLLARVLLKEEPSGKTHQITLVEIEGKEYIVDVGFGAGSSKTPLPIIYNEVIENESQTYRFLNDEKLGLTLQIKEKGKWMSLYAFHRNYIVQSDIVLGNYYSYSNPNSHFTYSRIACLHTKLGVKKLFNNRLSIENNNEFQEFFLKEDQATVKRIEREFNITLNESITSFKTVEDMNK